VHLRAYSSLIRSKHEVEVLDSHRRAERLERGGDAGRSSEEPVPRRVDLSSPEALQLPTDGFVMHCEKLPPTLIAYLSGRDSRTNNVREEDGR
jgi:hypothetical protein